MDKFSIYTLKAFRKVYTKYFGEYELPKIQREEDPDKISDIISNLLVSDKPCMIARFGAFELSTIVNYIGIQRKNNNILKYIKGESLAWWWNEKLITYMNSNAGFFPPTQEKIEQFCKLMLEDTKEVDLLASWLPIEYYVSPFLNSDRKIAREPSIPFFTTCPWTKILEGKKVLVIHPFIQTIEKQYKENRKKLFANPDILPDFELQTVQAVQSIGGESNGFKDWFEALEYMEKEMDKIDYNICLIGCGAYGFPLAAHAKRMGKKAVHLGGSLQLLFGIRGARWENPNYNKKYNYAALMNEYWTKPEILDRPKNADQVEGACYW